MDRGRLVPPVANPVCGPGQAHADPAGEVWVRRPLPVNVQPGDGKDDQALKQVHGRPLMWLF